MTKLEERLSEKLQDFLEAEQAGNVAIVNHFEYQKSYGFKAGFKAALELPELKALYDALSEAHDYMGNAGQTAWDGDDELKRMILSGGCKKIRDAKDKWRSFIGEGGNEANS